MNNFMKLLFSLILINSVQTELVPNNSTDEDIQLIVNDAIDEIESLTKGLKKKSTTFAVEFFPITEKLANVTNTFLFQTRKTLGNQCGLLEDKIEEISGFSLSNATCGVLSFRGIAEGTFKVIDKCVMSHINETVDDLHNFVKKDGKVSEELVHIAEEIKNCTDYSKDVKTVQNCVDEVKSKAFTMIEELNSQETKVRKLDNIGAIVYKMEECLLMKTVKNVIKKAQEVSFCLIDKMASFVEAAKKIHQATEFVSDEIIHSIMETKKDLIKLPKKFKKAIKKGFTKVKNELKKIWTKLINKIDKKSET